MKNNNAFEQLYTNGLGETLKRGKIVNPLTEGNYSSTYSRESY